LVGRIRDIFLPVDRKDVTTLLQRYFTQDLDLVFRCFVDEMLVEKTEFLVLTSCLFPAVQEEEMST
jgi:hypothetical protein